MVLKRLSDTELNQYGIGAEENWKDDVKKRLDKVDEKLIFLQNEVKVLKAAFDENMLNGKFIDESILKINKGIKYIVHSMDFLGHFSGTDRKQYMGEDKEITFSQEKDHLHLEFPGLLPKRLDAKSALSHKDLEAMYAPTFEKFFNNKKRNLYKEKVIIVYTHYFSAKKLYVDHDNFETKMITDLIASYVLLDDSPSHCAIMFDYKLGEKDHTEVDVYPFEKYCADFKK